MAQVDSKMSVEDKWEAMMASIQDAGHRLNMDLTEADMPEYFNWFVGRDMHQKLWAQVYTKRRPVECLN